MGAEWSVDASYNLGEPLKCENKFWKIYPAVSKKDDVSATVFIHDYEKDEDYGIDKAVKYLRTLRHPGLLKCHEVVETSEELSVVTEPVIPLANVVDSLNVQEVIAGIHGIITTVAFLHTQCELSHNNLSVESIFVGQNDACWKIGGFECMCAFRDMTSELMTQIKPFREKDSIPPEGENVQAAFVHVQDAFGMGKLISDILGQIDAADDPLVDYFHQRVEAELLHPNFEERPQLHWLLNDDLFKNGYIEILEFLNNITVKTSEEKTVFFRHLHKKLQDLPPQMVAHRLLHLLLSRFVLVDPVAVEIFLPHLLTPLSGKRCTSGRKNQSTDIIPLLPEQQYKESCIPILEKLFGVNDRHVRMILLKYFHLYVGMFEKNTLRKVILHQLMLGLRDSDDELVSATFSALQYLVPLLGSKIVIGGERMQQFTERRPKFDSQTVEIGPDTYLTSHLKNVSLSNETKPLESKIVDEKMMERERRRQETKRRNEERRKQKERLKMEKFVAKKAAEFHQVHHESDDELESWGDLSAEREHRLEVSDGSEFGRPSSSEISLDSGFSEKTRPPSSPISPVSPRNFREKSQETLRTAVISKTHTSKGGSGMKLGKSRKSSLKRKESNPEHISSLTSIDGDKPTTSHKNNTVSKKDTSKSFGNKKKTVDAPWKDFEINVEKKGFVEEDLFADMAPTLSCAPTSSIKGKSMYSDKLSVDGRNKEIGDGWMNDDW